MGVLWGVVIIGLGLFAWIGQAISWLSPEVAVRLSLADAEDRVDAVFWADGRGEALWDSLSLWTLPLAGVLLIAGHEARTWFGLVGGGMYLYIAGRGILTRVELRRRGHSIGEPADVRLGLTALAIWGVAGSITAIAAGVALA